MVGKGPQLKGEQGETIYNPDAAVPDAGFDATGYGTAASLGLSAIGSMFAASAQLRAGKAQKKMYEYNAKIATYQAEDAYLRGELAVARQGRVAKKVIGQQRSALAAQGVQLDEGSAADVEADTVFTSKLEEMRIRSNAAREAWGYKVQAKDFLMKGDYAQQTAQWAATSTVLTAGSRLALAKYGYGRSPLHPDPTV